MKEQDGNLEILWTVWSKAWKEIPILKWKE